MLANLFDISAIANWQRAGDAKAERPKPFPRPGEEARKQAEIKANVAAWQARRTARAKGEL